MSHFITIFQQPRPLVVIDMIHSLSQSHRSRTFYKLNLYPKLNHNFSNSSFFNQSEKQSKQLKWTKQTERITKPVE
jgi:hypothetical protein